MVDPSSTPEISALFRFPLFFRSFFLPFSLSISLPVYRRLFDSLGFSANFPSSWPRETASRQSSPSKSFFPYRSILLSFLPFAIILYPRLPTTLFRFLTRLSLTPLSSSLFLLSSSIHLRSRPKTRVLRIISGDPSTRVVA